MSLTVRSHWAGDKPAILSMFPGGAFHGSKDALATVIYNKVPEGIRSYLTPQGIYAPPNPTKPGVKALALADKLTNPCIYLGNMIKDRASCQGGPIFKCGLHTECTKTKCRDVPHNCLNCNDYIGSIEKTFDRVVLINLKKRPDRLDRAIQMFSNNWPFAQPLIFEAIDGYKVPTPEGWTKGRGAWGCLQSHRQVLEAAILDNVNSILVLEDDAVLVDDFESKVKKFLRAVPSDWEGLMLGGQHFVVPTQVKDGVLRCANCQRTHAYAVRGRLLKDLYSRWHARETWGHCDHVLGPFTANYKTYAPRHFLIGQNSGKSNINGKTNPVKFWNPARIHK